MSLPIVFSLSKELKSYRKSIRLIEPMLMEIKKRLPISDEMFFDLLISLTEAVNNAITHGNKSDPEKNVLINIDATEKEICVEVKDEGEGFNPQALADPRAPENLMKEGGRGVFIIYQITDKVEYNITSSGTSVKMYFYL